MPAIEYSSKWSLSNRIKSDMAYAASSHGVCGYQRQYGVKKVLFGEAAFARDIMHVEVR